MARIVNLPIELAKAALALRTSFVGLFLILWLGPSAASQTDRGIRREHVVSWLQQNETQVGAMECQFRCVYSISTPETIALLKATFRNTENPNEYRAAIWTEQDRLNWNFSNVKKWWRKGALEREEVYGLYDDLSGRPRYIRAFDGQIVRSLNYDGDGGKKIGTVETIKSSRWNDFNLQSPFSFLYECYRVPYSRVVAEAESFLARKVILGGKPYTEVNIKNAKRFFNGSLLFDQQHRLVERRWLNMPHHSLPGKEPILRQRHVFTQYQAHADPSGEIIWYPREIVYHYYVGYAPDGTLAETGTKTYTIEDIKFNIDIPDEKFDLKISKDAKVLDGVTGLGWLPEGERPATLFPEEARQARWTTAIIISTLILIAGGAYWYWRRRKGALAKI